MNAACAALDEGATSATLLSGQHQDDAAAAAHRKRRGIGPRFFHVNIFLHPELKKAASG